MDSKKDDPHAHHDRATMMYVRMGVTMEERFFNGLVGSQRVVFAIFFLLARQRSKRV